MTCITVCLAFQYIKIIILNIEKNLEIIPSYSQIVILINYFNN